VNGGMAKWLGMTRESKPKNPKREQDNKEKIAIQNRN
jgi:hypothetical protein